MIANLILLFKADPGGGGGGGGGHLFLDTGSANDRYKMRRKSDCGLMAFQLQQRQQQQQPFQQVKLHRPAYVQLAKKRYTHL